MRKSDLVAEPPETPSADVQDVCIIGFEHIVFGLAYIPPSIIDSSALRSLTLSFNDIDTLDNSLSCLRNLRLLNLEANQFAAIPPVIAEFALLETLVMTCNFVREIPDFVFGLPLAELNLGSNFISVLPDEFSRLKSTICVLHLHDNLFEVLPRSLEDCDQLESFTWTGMRTSYRNSRHIVTKTKPKRRPGLVRDHSFMRVIDLAITWPATQRALGAVRRREPLYDCDRARLLMLLHSLYQLSADDGTAKDLYCKLREMPLDPQELGWVQAKMAAVMTPRLAAMQMNHWVKFLTQAGDDFREHVCAFGQTQSKIILPPSEVCNGRKLPQWSRHIISGDREICDGIELQ